MRKKTRRYLMEINVLDTLATETELTYHDYDKMMISLTKQYEASKDAEEETFRVRMEDKFSDTEKYTKKERNFSLGTTDITMVKIVCKPGFCFSK